MNFTETIKQGQYYRVFDKLNNDGTRHYNRYSFVTNASDVIFEDGSSAEDKLGGSSGSLAAINEEITALKKSVSDGKKTVADAVTGNGVNTATDAAFSVIASNIDTMAKNKYDAGIAYADSRVNINSANYKSGYGTGHTEGYKEAQNKFSFVDKTIFFTEYWGNDTKIREITVDLTPISRISSLYIAYAAGSTAYSDPEDGSFYHLTHYYFMIDDTVYWQFEDRYSGGHIYDNSDNAINIDVSQLTGNHKLRIYSECETASPNGRPANPGQADNFTVGLLLA